MENKDLSTNFLKDIVADCRTIFEHLLHQLRAVLATCVWQHLEQRTRTRSSVRNVPWIRTDRSVKATIASKKQFVRVFYSVQSMKKRTCLIDNEQQECDENNRTWVFRLRAALRKRFVFTIGFTFYSKHTCEGNMTYKQATRPQTAWRQWRVWIQRLRGFLERWAPSGGCPRERTSEASESLVIFQSLIKVRLEA